MRSFRGGALEFWWELAALITVMLLGHWMEMRSIGQARGALAALAELLPDDAELVTDGGTETVSVSEVTVDDVVLVRPGARIPADGEIVEGSAEIDESMVTGESHPVAKTTGDRVVAGTVATDSAIRGSKPLVTTPLWRESSGLSPKRNGLAPGLRCSPIGPPRCSSTWPLAPRR